MDVLLRRVVELVLPGAAEALLDARVGPQAHHGAQQLSGVRLCVFHTTDDVTHHLSVRLQHKHKKENNWLACCKLFLRD